MTTFLSRLSPRNLRSKPPIVPVLRLSGVIGQGGGLRQGLTLAALAGPIEKAFSMKHAPAVALAINSPGGSPVQSALIAGRIRELAAEKKKPVYAFVEDVAASGGYWLALAADAVYADKSSIVGSIGVVSAGFGFPELIARHGVERRVYTAGSSKVILDPFKPEREEDVEKLRALQRDIHEAFKDHVRDRRAGKLTAGDDVLFEGDFWTGSKALEFGLIDGIGHMLPVLREKFGEKVKLRAVTQTKGWLRRRLNFGSALEGFAADAIAAVEERAHWQRFGL
ncbi:S49 family peptidase [Inquilinus sp. CAU 1745]|uniref:S49 family peptidase n=1 Tax=Inquilinus sp. CAU 1745 TaxID=3140369 RepID=UPI00325A9F04